MSLIQGADWQGKTIYATKKQLISSITGLYEDIQDISISSITAENLTASTLTVKNWISSPDIYTETLQATKYVSTPILNVSTIIGAAFDISGSVISISTGNFSLLSLSSLQFKAFDVSGSFSPDFEINLGLGSFLGGLVGNLGGLLAGTLGAITGGVGIGTGIAGLTQPRVKNLINNTSFETVNGSTQLQVSTLGNAFPYYSSITRQVSTTGILGIGVEEFVSTIFPAGTKCIRSFGDPLYMPTMEQTSSIQYFGQWVPVQDEFFDTISTINLNASTINAINGTYTNLTTSNLFASNVDILYSTSNAPGLFMSNNGTFLQNETIPYTNQIPTDFYTSTSIERAFYGNRFRVSTIYPSTTWPLATSTFGATSAALPADLSGVANFTSFYQQTGLPNTYCTAWNISSATFDVNNLGSGALQILIPPTVTSNDFLTPQNRVLVFPNQNRRVSWNIDPVNNTGTSSITTIPPALSTTITNNFITEMIHTRDPYEDVYTYLLTQSPQLGNVAFNVSTMAFGHPTTRDNGLYPFQFYGNTNIYGTLEVDTLIVLSSIISVSSIIEVESVISTTSLLADSATIDYLTANQISTNSLKTSTLNAYDSAVFASNVTFNNGAANFITNSFLVGAGNGAFPNLQLRLTDILANSNYANLTTDGSGGIIISDWYNFAEENVLLKSVRDMTNTTYNSLINISTLNVNTISTNSHNSDNMTLNDLTIQNSLTFTTPVYQDYSNYDITKAVDLVSTSFGSISSFRNNILSYTLCNSIQDQSIWNLMGSNTGFGVDYRMGPANVAQWGSTIMFFDDGQNAGDILLDVYSSLSTIGFTGTFDLSVQANDPNFPDYVQSFAVYQLNGNPPGPTPGQQWSTMLFVNNPPDEPGPPETGIWRFTIGTSGWIESVEANPTPYATVNSNVLQIEQGPTETTITTTDRLSFIAGDFQFAGPVSLSNVTTGNITAQSINLPDLNTNQNAIQMELEAATSSNNYNILYGSIQEGSAFPQASNNFSINLTASNAMIQGREDIWVNTINGDTFRFLGAFDTVQVDSGTLAASGVRYGDSLSGYLQPRAFRQAYSNTFSASQSFSAFVEVTDGTNTFPSASYNLMTCLASFYIDNSSVAWGEVVLAPFTSNNNWWVNVTGRLNAVSSELYTISWNNLLFPYNMMT